MTLISSDAARAVLEARLRALYEISEALSRASAREEIASVVTGQIIRVFGATMAGLVEITADGHEAMLIGAVGFPAEALSTYLRFPVDSPFPLRDAVRTKSPVVVRDLAAWRERYEGPTVAADLDGSRVVLPMIAHDRVNGAITFTFDSARDFADDDVDFMMTVAHHCALALERARLFEEHAQNVEALTKLHAITVSVSAALTKVQVAKVITDHLTGTLGAITTGVMELSEDGSELILLYSTNWTDAQRERLKRFSLDLPLPVRDAVLRRAPVFLRNVQEWLDAGYSAPPGGFASDPTGARVALPLLIGDRAIGVLSLTYARVYDFTAADREFLLAVAHQCAQAIDRARLYDAEHTARLAAEEAALKKEQLQRSASALATTITRHDVARCVVQQVREAMQPAAAAILELTDDGTQLRLLVADGASDVARTHYSLIPLDANVPATDVIKTLRPSFITTQGEWEETYPLPAIIDHARQAWATVPMVVERRAVGVLTLTFNEPREFPAEEREFLNAFANQCAIAIERARLYEAEQEARNKAEHANAAKSQFLGIMSHELRTPLNAVIGYADLLLMEVRGTLTTEQKVQVERIRSSAWHQLTLIEEILSYARIEAGKEEIRLGRVSINEIINDTVELLRPDAHRKKLALKISVDGPDNIVETDAAKVRQILLNLAGNAVKFTQQGTVELGARRSLNAITCFVTDTGPGIPADKLDLIWQPFTQVDSSDTRHVGGTGLGLTIARRLAILLGGSLVVYSTPGQGTTFEFRLPSASA
jgi:signal transduction histidine kinase